MAHSHAHQTDNYTLETARFNAGRNTLVFAALVSVIASAAGYAMDADRFFESYLVAFAFTTAIGLGAFFFVQVQYLTGSAWSVGMRRVMENVMTTLPVGLVLFLPLLLGLNHLYPWTNPTFMASSDALKAKAGYLTQDGFVTRSVVYFVLWSLWALMIYRNSIKQDTERSAQRMHAITKWSAPGLFMAVVVGSLASFDWLMSLLPGWYSTIFGLYYLSNGALGFMAVMALVLLSFRKNGILAHTVQEEHYHDLGKWLFALTCFYAYIATSQYILIWYADLPEETIFYRMRTEGGWLMYSLAFPILRFFFPFFTLLCRPMKRKLGVIGFLAAWSLLMIYMDLYWLVMPNFHKEGPSFHWLDLATLGATVSIAGLAFWMRFGKNKIVPVGDLRLEQSLHFENV
jgi:hypothetical protein